mmetsp:Transcript_99116/g.221217  ORF Transcript_99116/g.221217 Transcript_99116/m.221217 type:complete len:239 (-) Transcript_99116:47-763(-)
MANSGRAPAAAASLDVSAGLAQLSAALEKLAPRLAPSAAPGSAAFGAGGASLLSGLYAGEDSVDQLRDLQNSPQKCTLCGGSRSDGTGGWDIDWNVDLAKRQMIPQGRCRLLCGQCGAIRDLPRLIERLSQPQGQDGAAASGLLRHFLEVNGHDAADVHLLQDAVSVAHAMLVIYKELRLVPARGPTALRELLSGASGAAGGAAEKKRRAALPPVGGGKPEASEEVRKKRKGKQRQAS